MKTSFSLLALVFTFLAAIAVVTTSRGSGIGTPAYMTIEQAGSALTQRATVNFAANMTCTDDAGDLRTNCTPAAGGTYYQTVQNGGTPLPQEPILNLTTNITCADDPTNTRTNCAASGGGGGGGASRGTFSSRGSCSTSGSVYFSTDAPITSECNGSSWADWVFGRPVVLPSTISYTWQNQGGASVNTNGIAAMSVPTSSGTNIRGQYISLPSTPFTIDACIASNFPNVNASAAGLYVSDGTKLVTFALLSVSGQFQLVVNNYNSVTSFDATAITAVDVWAGGNQICLRWSDNGTNVTYSTSLDGQNFQTFGSNSRTAWLTPTQIGWFGDAEQTTLAGTVTLYDWYQH